MPDEIVTTDLILSTLKEWVETKQPIAPHLWIDACSKLNILKGDEVKILFDLQQKVAIRKVALIENGDSVAKAKAKTDASDEYKFYKIQEAKIEMIDEQIRIAKIQSRVGSDEIRGY